MCSTFFVLLLQQPPNEHYSFLLPEFELVIDSEDSKDKKDEDDNVAEARRKSEAAKLPASDLTDDDLSAYAMGENDTAFKRFKKRIAAHKEQVLRYDRGGEPLWISDKLKLPTEKVPNCEHCQSKRVFEFQVSLFWVIRLAAYQLIKSFQFSSSQIIGS